MFPDMNSSETRILCTGLIVLFSLVFGFLPALFRKRIQANARGNNGSQISSAILSILLNFGAGVLIANCFCHWLPELRKSLADRHIETVLPLAEIIMCTGLFFIIVLEEIIQLCVSPKKESDRRKKSTSRKVDSTSYASSSWAEMKDSPDSDPTSGIERTKSAVRTFFVVSALSFHSTIEGLALAIEQSNSGIWMNFGATALHKFVIAFSVGVELLSSQTSRLNYFISMLVFAFAPAVGVLIAVILEVFQEGESFDEFPFQILQGIATGTVVYVVFFEIIPKGKIVGGNGLQHASAIIFGFITFLPSLFLHDSLHDDNHSHQNATIPNLFS